MDIALVVVYGLVIGSFLNVCVWRVPRGMSIVRPGSHCPACGTMLRARDLVPVFSFLARKGKCAYCGESIPVRYPLVELATALGFLALYLLHGVSGEFLLRAALFCLALCGLLAARDGYPLVRAFLYPVLPLILGIFLLEGMLSTVQSGIAVILTALNIVLLSGLHENRIRRQIPLLSHIFFLMVIISSAFI